MADDVIEIAYTTSAGWCWRCHRCDVNGFNLPTRSEAEGRAAEHCDSEQHCPAECGCEKLAAIRAEGSADG